MAAMGGAILFSFGPFGEWQVKQFFSNRLNPRSISELIRDAFSLELFSCFSDLHPWFIRIRDTIADKTRVDLFICFALKAKLEELIFSYGDLGHLVCTLIQMSIVYEVTRL
jgi:hypothetical protein